MRGPQRKGAVATYFWGRLHVRARAVGDRFSPPDYLFGKEPNAFLRSQAHLLRAGRSAPSVAEGEGGNGVWLVEQGLDVLSIDHSPTALAKSRALARERGVRLRTKVPTSSPGGGRRTLSLPRSSSRRTPPTGRHSSPTSSARSSGRAPAHAELRPEELTYRAGGPRDVERLATRPRRMSAYPRSSSSSAENSPGD
jgi:hypothetical protein